MRKYGIGWTDPKGEWEKPGRDARVTVQPRWSAPGDVGRKHWHWISALKSMLLPNIKAGVLLLTPLGAG